ncbi:Hypothetical protein CAP_2848 [Chondromyces apiculatus DSM 436]|uniref:Uncharacterized protein n=1 Tax=Chondromyces apiculatus DSM 436 TaxID=1192034 RepID=A0A017TA94_9BACT|nr:Hypothetical protein CAP_2848 [Chondromyces apiculatus DSM 436]
MSPPAWPSGAGGPFPQRPGFTRNIRADPGPGRQRGGQGQAWCSRGQVSGVFRAWVGASKWMLGPECCQEGRALLVLLVRLA